MRCLECSSETTNPKFCSLSCSIRTQMKNKPKRMSTCEECDREYEYKTYKRFCTRTCSATFNNKRRTGPRANCKNCEKKIGESAKNFCSTTCSATYKSLEKLNSWLSGEWNGSTSDGVSSTIKRFLIQESGYKCSECSWDKIHPVTGRTPLEVDHIDGNCYNNSRSNLRVVCPNCHSLSPNYRALNKGSGRAFRRKSHSPCSDND